MPTPAAAIGATDKLGDIDEPMRIFATVAAELDDVIVAHFFGGRIQASRKKPHQRLKEQQRRSDAAQQIPIAIAACQVRQLMNQDVAHRQA